MVKNRTIVLTILVVLAFLIAACQGIPDGVRRCPAGLFGQDDHRLHGRA